MGLQNDFSKFGITFEDAYHRIVNLNYRVEEYIQPVMITSGSIDASGSMIPPVYENSWAKRAYGGGEIETYASEAARTAHSESLARTHFSFNYDLESEDSWIEQAYAHAKTLVQFTGSIDVL
jgi:hypothetical protein